MGQAASMGAFLLAAGAKGKRYALPHSRIMIHQPLGGVQGQATDIEIHAKEILRTARQAERAAASSTPASRSRRIERDIDRDYFMSAERGQGVRPDRRGASRRRRLGAADETARRIAA